MRFLCLGREPEEHEIVAYVFWLPRRWIGICGMLYAGRALNKCVVGVFGGSKDDWHSRAFGADLACAGLR